MHQVSISKRSQIKGQVAQRRTRQGGLRRTLPSFRSTSNHQFQCRDLDGSCPVPWFLTTFSKISFGIRSLSGIIPNQVSPMFSQVCSSWGLSALFAIRKQWTALARYLSALRMAVLLTHGDSPKLRQKTKRASVTSITECPAGSITSRGLKPS